MEPPSSRELERISDRRAAQFWDKRGVVSKAISGAIVARGQDEKRQRYKTSGERLWDTVAVYPAGVQWGDSGPAPAYTGGPVVNVASELGKALGEALRRH